MGCVCIFWKNLFFEVINNLSKLSKHHFQNDDFLEKFDSKKLVKKQMR
jgi:hypothetical protein